MGKIPIIFQSVTHTYINKIEKQHFNKIIIVFYMVIVIKLFKSKQIFSLLQKYHLNIIID